MKKASAEAEVDDTHEEVTYRTPSAYSPYTDDDDDDHEDDDLDDLLFDKPTSTTNYSDDPNSNAHAHVDAAKKNQDQNTSRTNTTLNSSDKGDTVDKANSNSIESDESDDEFDEDDGLLEPFQARNTWTSGGDSDHNDRRRGGSEFDQRGEEEDDSLLRPGDHIYVWKSSGMFGMKTYQKHGIVLSLDPNDENNVSIVTFYHKNEKYIEPERRASFFQKKTTKEDQDSWEPYRNEDETDASLLGKDSNQENAGHGSAFATASGAANRNKKFTPTVRVESLFAFTANSKGGIQKVKYRASLAKRLLSRGGTVTCCSPDEQALVLARVKYLLESPGRMPEFHMMAANGECAAVWCRMGRWCTLQGSSILHILFVGQAGGAAVGGVVASNVMLWAPMPGFWGSIGYIWFVPATVAYPLLVPFLIGFGLASLVPLEALRRFRKKWAEISSEMNQAFWANTDPMVRECFFSLTVSADDDWMKKFFGDTPVGGGKTCGGDEDKLEEDRGQYMPVGNMDTDTNYCATTTTTDSNSSFGNNANNANMDQDEMMKRVSAEYGIAGLNSSDEHDFAQEWGDGTFTSSAEEIKKWNTMSFGGEKNKVNHGANKFSHDDDETNRPLTDR